MRQFDPLKPLGNKRTHCPYGVPKTTNGAQKNGADQLCSLLARKRKRASCIAWGAVNWRPSASARVNASKKYDMSCEVDRSATFQWLATTRRAPAERKPFANVTPASRGCCGPTW